METPNISLIFSVKDIIIEHFATLEWKKNNSHYHHFNKMTNSVLEIIYNVQILPCLCTALYKGATIRVARVLCPLILCQRAPLWTNKKLQSLMFFIFGVPVGPDRTPRSVSLTPLVFLIGHSCSSIFFPLNIYYNVLFSVSLQKT